MCSRPVRAQSTLDRAHGQKGQQMTDSTDTQTLHLVVPDLVPLDKPSVEIPHIINTPSGLERTARTLAAMSGPVAVDTERAQGIRYGIRAFLVQIKREDKIFLIDPVPFNDLSIINDALADAEWVIHAAIQDFPSLDMLGMRPKKLFDTELGARLLGFPRVNLGTVVEKLLGYKLAKSHSAEDWSQRPLPESWLNYALLDVDVLLDLRDALEELLESQGKLEYAHQEFEYLCTLPVYDPDANRAEKWRKTKGRSVLTSVYQLTALRNLWFERDKLARQKDMDPKSLLPDSALVQAALEMPRSVPKLHQIPGFQTRLLGREATRWIRAIVSASRDKNPVPFTIPSTALPPLKAWETKNPQGLEILAGLRAAISGVSEQLNIPDMNLLLPETVKRIAWEPPKPYSKDALRAQLVSLEARAWQIDLLLDPMDKVLAEHLS